MICPAAQADSRRTSSFNTRSNIILSSVGNAATSRTSPNPRIASNKSRGRTSAVSSRFSQIARAASTFHRAMVGSISCLRSEPYSCDTFSSLSDEFRDSSTIKARAAANRAAGCEVSATRIFSNANMHSIELQDAIQMPTRDGFNAAIRYANVDLTGRLQHAFRHAIAL